MALPPASPDHHSRTTSPTTFLGQTRRIVAVGEDRMEEYKGVLEVHIDNLHTTTWHSGTGRFPRSCFLSARVLGSFGAFGAWCARQGTLGPDDGMWCFPVEMLRTLKLPVISKGKSWLDCDLPSEVEVEMANVWWHGKEASCWPNDIGGIVRTLSIHWQFEVITRVTLIERLRCYQWSWSTGGK